MPHTPHLDTYDEWLKKFASSGFTGHEAEVCAELYAIADEDSSTYTGKDAWSTPGHIEYVRGCRSQLEKAGVRVP